MSTERTRLNWLRGPRAAALAILLWVAGWSIGVGGLAEAFVDPNGETLDIWPAELAIPGFAGGVLFAALLLLVEGRRRLDQVAPARFVAWGIATGLVLGVLSQATGGPIPLSLPAAGMIGLATGLGALAALGTWASFRLLGARRRPAIAARAG